MSEDKRTRLSNLIFYIALTIELVLMIAEKSEISLHDCESMVFKCTFALTVLAVIIMKHGKREWIAIGVIAAFTFICWRFFSGKNELLRFSMFMIAARDIDLKKVMKYIFYVSLAGFALIALLSVVGVLGNIYMITDYGRDNAQELRYVFGFGHPNTLYGCVFALSAMWMWIYGQKSRIISWLLALAFNVAICLLSKSKTALAICIIMFATGLLVRYWNKIAECRIIYILTALVTPVFCVAFSVWSACVSYIPRYHQEMKCHNFISAIDELLTNRIHDLYRGNERHAGAIETWKLFSDRMSEETFDMGWVRLFYWYGIIPAVIISLLVILLIYICYKKKDAMTLVIILSLSIYTVVEATFVSRFIGRLFIFPIAAIYLWEFFSRDKIKEERS
ncbi:hypothetical protein D6853_13840 [Butyrivibrio sp. X503]|uniref:hypothetical protein n=1 Tax=Butyrivibrio sp. X503 TaxID=2364878 RepID=UPI000EA90B05|nr:hypothetical protein [Butyrivibrio sp. X503]RKM54305.1 hypothetical protein D6853_13840 [Butyrivibrio sp. X503]